jgi:hypothetical protein
MGEGVGGVARVWRWPLWQLVGNPSGCTLLLPPTHLLLTCSGERQTHACAPNAYTHASHVQGCTSRSEWRTQKRDSSNCSGTLTPRGIAPPPK